MAGEWHTLRKHTHSKKALGTWKVSTSWASCTTGGLVSPSDMFAVRCAEPRWAMDGPARVESCRSAEVRTGGGGGIEDRARGRLMAALGAG